MSALAAFVLRLASAAIWAPGRYEAALRWEATGAERVDIMRGLRAAADAYEAA